MKFFCYPLFLPSISVFLTGIFLVVILCWGHRKELLNAKVKKREIIFRTMPLIVFPILLFLTYVIWPENCLARLAKPIAFATGLTVAYALWSLHLILLECITRKIPIVQPDSMNDQHWKDITEMPAGGEIVGRLELILYFIALLSNPVYIGGLLTFKIAAKWEAWKNIVQVPDHKLDAFPSEISYFIFRRKLGSRLLNRFLVGTFGNILFAVVGYGFYKWFLIVLDP